MTVDGESGTLLQKSGIEIVLPLFLFTLRNYWSQPTLRSFRQACNNIEKRFLVTLYGIKGPYILSKVLHVKQDVELLEIPRGPRGIDSVSLDPRVMLYCHSSIPRFLEE